MRSAINNYVILLKEHREQYGSHAIILYQVGFFYYIFSNNQIEINKIKDSINLPWCKKKQKDDYFRCWIEEDKLTDNVKLLIDNDFTCIVYKLNTRLCIHNRRERECKLCGDLSCTHLLYDIIMPQIDMEYVIL